MPLERERASVEEISPASITRGERRSVSWLGKIAGLLMVLICAEVGIVLLVFPWLDLWEQNYLSSGGVQWSSFWMNAYFRGAVSGLGVVNIYIALMELLRFTRLFRS